jgi:nucleotide-binding universal stress UspA family protein
MFKRILVAVDVSESDLTTLVIAAAAELAKAANADVRLVDVRFMVATAVEYLPKNFFDEEQRRTLAELERLARVIDLQSALISVSSPMGTVYEAVLAEAASFDADLIVVGPHRPSMSAFLLGSNAAQIVRHAKCSVLVVRR